MTVRLPAPSLVVLVGPGASGKSTWAATWFRPSQVVSADAIRAMVGEGEHDQRASKDAFAVLENVIERRLRRHLLTVVDTLALDDDWRRWLIDLAARHRVPCHAVAFDTPARECRARNRGRERAIPPAVLSGQLKRWDVVRDQLASEGFAAVHPPEPVEIVPARLLDAPRFAHRQREAPMPLQFGLQIPGFTWPGGPAEIGPRLADIARTAEDVGFSRIFVMDHFIQIPLVGPDWHDMLDSYTALSFLAGQTTTARLGALVTGIAYRNIAHLGKIIATLDVLSGGRAICGLGAGWFEREHLAYGWRFPPLNERFDLLEDALRLLPLLWGPGSPSFSGKVVSATELVCYPRPLQERVPIMVGGSGEKKTLRLVARYADACNLFGDPDTVRRRVSVLHRHCDEVGRDPSEVELTFLTSALVAPDQPAVDALVERLRPQNVSPEAFADRVNAGTADDQIGRFRQFAEAGAQAAIVNFPGLDGPEMIERFAPVIAAFR
ncbi:MAG: TIGR03560 family F420-dependent LLM class oxidoreductase [Acidimicrobiales bacterium]